MPEFAAQTAWSEGRIAILSTRWNSFITDNLVQGAQQALARNGVPPYQVDLVLVPGAFELPIAAQGLAQTGRYAGLVALGCVIRGGTPHFEYVCGGCMDGLMRVQLDANLPITFGVLTVDNVEQAIERSGDDTNNKGMEAAVTLLEMINLLKEIA